MLNITLWTEKFVRKPWKMNKKGSKHVNPTDINFSNSKSHISNCIGKQEQCFWWQRQCLEVKSWSQVGRKEIKACLVAFWIFFYYYNKLFNQHEVRTTILTIKCNLIKKARFNLNNRNYLMNARKKAYKYTKEVLHTQVGAKSKGCNPLGKISAGLNLDSSSLIKR